MNKQTINLLLVLFLYSILNFLHAQTFSDISAGLTGQGAGAGDWGDYDNDGDLDLVVVGYTYDGNFAAGTKLYRNDGNKVFTSVSHSLQALGDGSAVKWGDYDNDGDLDLALSGIDAFFSGTAYTKIYRNDNGSFTDISAGLPGTNNSSLAWGDYDNDGDLDLLLTGYDAANTTIVSKIYGNNNGVFTDISAGLVAITRGYASWGDYDNDGDLDILMNGNTVIGNREDGTSSIIYRNDSGTFTNISAAITPLGAGNSTWGDYDGDGDLDLVVSGVDASTNLHTLIYKNTGGTFTDISAGLTGVQEGYADWGDYDNDGDLDLIVSGSDLYGGNSGSTKLYRNMGSDTFTDVTSGLPALNPRSSKICNEWGDYDNDGDLDFFIMGLGSLTTPQSYIYENTTAISNTAPNAPSGLSVSSNGNSTLKLNWSKSTDAETSQNGLTYNVRIGTIPGGSDLLSGMSNITNGFRRVAARGNSGHNNYYIIDNPPIGTTYYWGVQAIDNSYKGSSFASEGTVSGEGFNAVSAGFNNFSSGSTDWGDYDNDGDLDMLITGVNTTALYKNSGGSFSSVSTALTNLIFSDAKWGDYDNDGDMDVVLIGRSGATPIAQVFRNDGSDTFTNISASLSGVYAGSVDWGDYDNDGDLDLVISGMSNSSTISTKIYRNDGSDTFTDISASLTGVHLSYVKWVDVDNDGDLDLAVFGDTNLIAGTPNSSIYINNGGTFSLISSFIPAGAALRPSFGDYDNDGDMDLAFPFSTGSGVYYNDGSGKFYLAWSGPSLVQGFSKWGDYNNDGDLDLFLAGRNSGQRIARLYRNDGSNVFTDISAGLTGVDLGDAAWGDYDGDNVLDLIVIGHNGSSNITNLYKNYRNKSNTAPNAPTNLQTSVNLSSITFSWDKATDNETVQNSLTYNLRIGTTSGSSDVLSGMVNTSNGFRRISASGNANHQNSFTVNNLSAGKYYWSVQTIDNSFEGSSFATEGMVSIEGFAEYTASLIGVDKSDVAWGDYDSDGDLDVVVAGITSPNRYLRVYKNNSGTFTQVQDLAGFVETSLEWGDYDNDGDLDFVVAGYNGAYTTTIYRNDGSDTFNDISANITGAYNSSVNWVDSDNDGDLELFISGQTSGGQISKLYRNEGSDTFTEASTGIIGVKNGSSDWGDHDNDGDMDLLLTGNDGTNKITKLYRNNGSNSFTEVSITLPGVEGSSAIWGDYDNDGDLDIFISGAMVAGRAARIYRNDGGNTFTQIFSDGLGVQNGSASWGDFDNDGDLDIFYCGNNGNNSRTSSLYRNDGSNTFTAVTTGITGVEDAACNWGDHDNDGDLDLIISGYDGANNITKIFENFRNASNTVPNAPANLQTSVNLTSITFSWDKATDAETIQNGLTYNLVVGTTDGGSDVFSGMVNTSNGYRRVSQMGNTGANNSWTLDGLTGGQTYFWKVQTIDNAFQGSAFASGTSAQALPVELTSFTATQTENGILLEWETATEVNNYGFQVERRNLRGYTEQPADSNLEGYTAIGFVQGHGNSNSPKEYEFVDAAAPVGELQYRLKQIDTDGTFTYYGIIAEVGGTITSLNENQLPTEFSLSQNYPNPFNPTTTINYSIPTPPPPFPYQGEGIREGLSVSLKIYDILGNEVATLVNEQKSPGNYSVEFDAGKLPSGVYIYKIAIDNFNAAKKMTLIK